MSRYDEGRPRQEAPTANEQTQGQNTPGLCDVLGCYCHVDDDYDYPHSIKLDCGHAIGHYGLDGCTAQGICCGCDPEGCFNWQIEFVSAPPLDDESPDLAHEEVAR